MKQTVIIGTDAMLNTAREMFLRGAITQSQYVQMEERNARLDNNTRKNIIILR